MLCFPNCKINIGLFVTSKRSDGYHNIETVFYPLPFTDALEIIPSYKLALHTSGLAVGGHTEDNLVYKAYTLLQQQFPDVIQPMNIYLHKAIPMGAGVGGGSADGAFMLRLLNDYYHLGLTTAELEAFALQLGSDCPFFIANKPAMATGRGERMEAVSLDLSGYSIQLICPAVHVSTREAFSMLTPRPAPFSLIELSTLPITDWKHVVRNDFEASVFNRHRLLASIKQQLYDQGAHYASMSGSGSAVYGIFPKGKRAVISAPIAFKNVVV